MLSHPIFTNALVPVQALGMTAPAEPTELIAETEQATMLASIFILTKAEIGQIKADTTHRKRTCGQAYKGKGKSKAISEDEAFSSIPAPSILHPTSSNPDENRVCRYCKSLSH